MYRIFFFLLPLLSFSQSNFNLLYDDYIIGDQIGSDKSINNLIDKVDTRYFIIISFYINSNNIMYTKTNNLKYLKKNQNIINKLKSNYSFFKTTFYKHEQNFELNGKESILLEGYLYRYVAQYYFLLSKIDKDILDNNHISYNFSFIENRFFYWYNKSLINKKDDSFLMGIRVHMGAQWATLALYMKEISVDKNNILLYEKFLERFDQNLNINLKKNYIDKGCIYLWNSTWDNKFTTTLKERQKKYNEEDVIQDTAHGAHVVEYILTAYKLSYANWSQEDINCLINTLKYSIYNSKTSTFSDLVNGKSSKDLSILDSGKKQSDGWMKLIEYDHELRSIYENHYFDNFLFLQKTNYFNQFISNLN